jgi:hypothetical protein
VTTSACDAATGGRDTSVAAYEELRRHVLAGSTVARDFALVIFLREGIAAWAARGSACAAPSALAGECDRRATVPIMSDEIQGGIVRVLASMAMAGRGEIGV